LQPAAGSFALETQNGSPVSALDQDYSWSAAGSFAGLSGAAGSGQHNLRAPFWLPREWELALHRRKSTLLLNQGYPLSLEQEIVIDLPGSSGSVTPPGARQNAAPPLRWQVEWRPPREGNKWTARFNAELASGELSTTETAAFQKQLRALRAALADGITFSKTQ
jgi:hypothetical protein